MSEPMRFGYLPVAREIRGECVVVESLPDLATRVTAVQNAVTKIDRWLYADSSSPLVRVPATHSLSLTEPGVEGRRDTEFLVFVLGLMEGLHLIPEDWAHLYRAPTSCGTLNDCVCSPAELGPVLDRTQRRWVGWSVKARKVAYGALFWLLSCRAYHYEFERFTGLYMVLDALYQLHQLGGGRKAPKHGERAQVMCTEYDVPVPAWARSDGSTSALAQIRNELFHEARYGGVPLGHAKPSTPPHLVLEVAGLCSRLMFALLNVDCKYVHTSAEFGTGARVGFELGMP